MLARRLLAALIGLSVVAGACGDDPTALPVTRAAVPTTAPTTTAVTTTPAPTAPSTTATATPAAPPTTPALQAIPPAVDPADSARRIAAAEAVVRDPATPEATVATRAFELQLLYRQLARNPTWDAPVIAAVPEALRLAVTANVAARREFRSMHTRFSDTLPAWRIVDPAPAAELLGYYREAEATFGVPWEILAAVNLVETGMGRIRGTSTAGAQGPMQFIPPTWAAFGAGGDINNTHDAIMGAARYLAHNGGGTGNIDGALYNYNHSDRYVAGVKHYASVLADDPASFASYYHWQIVYLSAIGDVWLPSGYNQTAKIPVIGFVQTHPGTHLGTTTD